MISPATQPSSAAPAQTRIGYRSSTAISIALPAMISGTLVARPKMISVVLMRQRMRHVDPHRRGLGRRRDRDDVVEAHHDVGDGDDAHRAPEVVAAFDAALSPCSSSVTISLIAIQSSSRPPTSLRKGIAHDLRDDER